MDTASTSLDDAKALIRSALRAGATADPSQLESIALALPKLSADDATQLALMLDAAGFFYVSGIPTTGAKIADAAREYAEQLGDVSKSGAAQMLCGICAADTGNLPKAMEAYAAAMTRAQSAGDTVLECKVWNNLGAALIYSGLFREAVACCNKALSLIANGDPRVQGFAIISYNNLALCHLNLGEPDAGIEAVNKSLSRATSPQSEHERLNRVLAGNFYVRLLIDKGDYSGALEQAKLAREFAAQSASPRADIQAAVAEGLAETFSGAIDVGVTRLKSTLERAKSLNTVSREVLAALVKALEHAGRHGEALQYLQEMLHQQRATAEANVLQHVRTHLAQLHAHDVNTQIEDVKDTVRRVETLVEVVVGKAAATEVVRHNQALFKLRVEAVERQAVLAELRDDATGAHSYRVGRLASILAKEAGCDSETVFMVDIAARLHDIGKAGIPDGILLKPGAFNTSERLIMENHAEIGASILAQSDIPNIEMAVSIARHHHERWDGRGYPAKIGGEEIPLPARITALADVFDALTHKRPYKPAWSVESALLEIASLRGTHFDPELTETFLSLMSRLQREHSNLDNFLGEAALASPFIQARGKIWETLQVTSGAYRAQ